MRSLTVSLLLLLPLYPAAAQWRLTLMHGTASVWGHSRDENSADHLTFLPDRPNSYTAAIGREFSGNRFTLELRRTGADLALRGSGTSIITRGALHAWGAAVEGMRLLAGTTGRPTLHGGLGAVVERWSFDLGDGDPRWRVAGRGALEVDLPITGRWNGVMRGEMTASASVFTAEELPESYVRRMGWSRGIEIGAGWKW